ncbi:basic amino acid ABC transporter substrate-binding protein [Paenibacillus sp. JX-17]|uniref:Basic amino acid ABC transporter substrate-binding protein n=1 Tax=Paenibacillus lacisoli TaxID=3064525 RepID=A0ABT9CE00_9BACL|nr:basic amino acid ABC transporter substrate-binding protein [Paenibacillus sp. JX-17]MDO7906864.1 basic amino acid ABC transporter substrate-binding protein [Paenibacillus sp. JX-17]
MKNKIMLFIITLMIVLVAGCGQKQSSSTAAGESSSGGGDQVMFATDASYAPMEYMDKDKLTGFDIDFIAAVMAEAGLDYDVKNTGWDTMLESVKQGKEYQAGISSVSVTEERKQTYDFSRPYFESTNMILVKKGSGITSAMDLKDKKVAVQNATTADTIMTGIMGDNSANLKKFDSNPIAIMELESGGVDAVVADVAIVNEYVKNNPGKDMETVADPGNFASEYYSILLPKGSELKAKLDPAIQKVIDNGEYAKIYSKWFGKEPDLANLKNAKE